MQTDWYSTREHFIVYEYARRVVRTSDAYLRAISQAPYTRAYRKSHISNHTNNFKKKLIEIQKIKKKWKTQMILFKEVL